MQFEFHYILSMPLYTYYLSDPHILLSYPIYYHFVIIQSENLLPINFNLISLFMHFSYNLSIHTVSHSTSHHTVFPIQSYHLPSIRTTCTNYNICPIHHTTYLIHPSIPSVPSIHTTCPIQLYHMYFQ